MMRPVYSLAALAIAAAAVMSPANALAGPHESHHHGGGGIAVPEINGANAGMALVLVAGGAAVILGRRRRQRSS